MSVRFIHIFQWFLEWGTHWIHLCTSNLQSNCIFKTLLWKQCSWWRISQCYVVCFISNAIRLGQIGKSMCKGVSRQVQAVSPAGFSGAMCESSPELCTGATACDTQQPGHTSLTQAWQLLMTVVTRSQRDWPGSTLYYHFCCWCLYIVIRVVGSQNMATLFGQIEQ